MPSASNDPTTNSSLLWRAVVAVSVSATVGWLAHITGIGATTPQVMAVSIFVLIVSATLFFWEFRLAIAFLGIAMLLGTRVMTLEEMIKSTELDIILFLVGMMTLVGVLKDLGLFSWMIHIVVSMKRMNGMLFSLILMSLSALMASVVDEVTSIVFMLALVFQVCDTLKVRPIPFVLMSVMATNIGSSATMLGNPVGILIGTKAGLTFNDFIKWATPVTAMCIIATLIILLLVFRRDIHLLSERLEARRNEQLGLGPLVRIPYRRGLLILISAVTLIALHHTIEEKLGVARNTILLVAPLAIAGILMVYRHKRARHYIESEVEWWTLLFFMMLFSVAGALEHTGITKNLADKFVGSVGHHKELLTPLIISVTALGSAFVDNIVFVAAFIPVVKQLDQTVLYWALLFGACFGGNITAIGSTANIVALGMLEKRHRIGISFMEWLKVGALIGLVTSLIAWGSLVAMQHIFPHHLQIKHSERPQQSQVIDGNESVTDKPSANDAVLVVPEEN